MKFGKVDAPELIDFTIPNDHLETKRVLSEQKTHKGLSVYVGCAKWNRQDLKNFYPKGTKDELTYYSKQFNCIEMNATFYRFFSKDQFEKWYDKTPEGFRFFPKLSRDISHIRRLNEGVYPLLENYLDAVGHLKEKLGTIFLQMHDNFDPKNWDRVVRFVRNWPNEFRLAIEFRHTDWFNDKTVSNELYHLLEENSIANVLTDTAGRRDLMHMRLTNDEAFIRYVGSNHLSDYCRLNDWDERLQNWVQLGLTKLHFFVHQNMELESPLLSSYLIERINKSLGVDLTIPRTINSNPQTLF